MATKYIQVAYHLPWNANSSVTSVTVSDEEITSIRSHEFITGGEDDQGVPSWVLTSEIGKNLDTILSDLDPILSPIRDEIGKHANNQSELQTTINNISILNTDATHSEFKWYDAELTVADDYSGDINEDIYDARGVDGSGNFTFSVTGLTVAQSKNSYANNYSAGF